MWVPLAQKYLNNCVAQQASLTSFYVFLLLFFLHTMSEKGKRWSTRVLQVQVSYQRGSKIEPAIWSHTYLFIRCFLVQLLEKQQKLSALTADWGEQRTVIMDRDGWLPVLALLLAMKLMTSGNRLNCTICSARRHNRHVGHKQEKRITSTANMLGGRVGLYMKTDSATSESWVEPLQKQAM